MIAADVANDRFSSRTTAREMMPVQRNLRCVRTQRESRIHGEGSHRILAAGSTNVGCRAFLPEWRNMARNGEAFILVFLIQEVSLDFFGIGSVTDGNETLSLLPECRALVGTGRASPVVQMETRMRDQKKGSEEPANCPPKGSNWKSKPPSQVGKPKTEVLRNLISRPTGATIEQIQKHFNWQPHTVRAAISRLRRPGVTIELDRSGKVTCYRLRPTGALK